MAEGVYNRRTASTDAAKVRAMKAEGTGATEIAKALKSGRASGVSSTLSQGKQEQGRSHPGTEGDNAPFGLQGVPWPVLRTCVNSVSSYSSCYRMRSSQ